jgi:deoxyribodipyrimidine photo-lyase
MSSKINIHWFRRDLRLDDNTALNEALNQGLPVLPIFIFDEQILNKLEDRTDKRVLFIHQTLIALKKTLENNGSSLLTLYGNPIDILKDLTTQYDIHCVFANHDYEAYGIQRDQEMRTYLETKGIEFSTYKDSVVYEKSEVVKDDGSPYTVFTPYSKKWKAKFITHPPQIRHSESLIDNFKKCHSFAFPSLAQMNFEEPDFIFPDQETNDQLISAYAKNRDIPAIRGTSRIGIHLRFGTISIRKMAINAGSISETFLNELIWRDFYHMILWNFPQVRAHESFKPVYDQIDWVNNEKDFERWCQGNTGYPIVDAGMRELNSTGFMHNRVRMIVASFLCKHLLIDWRWGEAYFAQKLLDFDLAANNGGWQWAAGSGCDSAPYFRIFNPSLQTKKFDPEHTYIRKWVPEYQELNYPKPMIDHEFARKRCLEVYKKGLQSN